LRQLFCRQGDGGFEGSAQHLGESALLDLIGRLSWGMRIAAGIRS
jgi:hypothetical protein